MSWIFEVGFQPFLAADPEPSFLTNLVAGPWFPFLIIGVLFYFLLVLPERKRKAEMSKMLNNLQKNDRVVTIGGVIGVVMSTQKGPPEDTVTIRIDDGNNTRMKILRSAVTRVLAAESNESGEPK